MFILESIIWLKCCRGCFNLCC